MKKPSQSSPTKKMATLMLLLLIAILPASAAQRTLQEMNSIAYSAFNLSETSTDPYAVPPLAVLCKSSDMLDASLFSNNEEAFYVFAYTTGAPGYVVVSADTRLPEVLAYSTTDHFHTDGMPESVRAYFQSFVEKMKNTPESFTAKRRVRGRLFANSTSASVEPLLGDIAFDQHAPFNNACPLINGTRAVTGCVATAMAQIMKYHQHPNKMKGSDISYTTSGVTVNWTPSTTTFDWTKIKERYTDYVPDYTATETVVKTTQMSISDATFSTDNYIVLHTFQNVSGQDLSFTVQFILTNSNGKFIRPIPQSKHITSLGYRYYYSNYYLRPSLPANIANGNYRLYIGIQPDGSSQWSYVKTSGEDYYLNVTKTDTYFTIEGSDYHYPLGYTDAEASEVAKLLAACGASVRMSYGTGASGASTVAAAEALINNFSYDPSIEILSPSLFSEADWHTRIQKELMSHRPILVSGTSDGGSGHAFIIDGFRFDQSTPYYHVNWGWSGSDNAYFLIDNMRPSEAGTGGYNENYSHSYELYFGIQPENNTDEGIALSSSYTVDNSTYSAGSTIRFSISQLKNISAAAFAGNVKAYACNGSRCYEIGDIISISTSNPLRTGYYYYGMNRSFTLPSNIPTGRYRIILKAQQTGSSVEREVFAADIPEVQINGTYLLGDVDKSGNVDISDVVMMVNYILGSESSANVLLYGDMDSSGNVDISDVVALVNLILGN